MIKKSKLSSVILIFVLMLFFNMGCGQDKVENIQDGEISDYIEEGLESVVLGGGCFWSMETIFTKLKGVKDVEVGYAGGDTENPTYEEVCFGDTGHAEVVKVIFDQDIISYEDLLEVFFYVHDPTTLNRQGNDVGDQYRSIILFNSKEQDKKAQEYIKELEEKGFYDDPIVTQVQPLDAYYKAEDYHQDYYEKNPNQPYCTSVIGPKIERFEERFADILK